MARPKQASKRKRRRTTLPVFGAAGVSLAMAGGASATAPTANVPSQDTAPRPVITLGEEEISDVSLATFYVFDKENVRARPRPETCSDAAAEAAAAEAAQHEAAEAAEAAAAQYEPVEAAAAAAARCEHGEEAAAVAAAAPPAWCGRAGAGSVSASGNERPAGVCEPGCGCRASSATEIWSARAPSSFEARFVRTSGRRCAY